jgi:POT family proton-dependent oligopeptide transporter
MTPMNVPSTAPAAATFLGHPRGLFTLFFTELWERFSYYGMRALLVLFMVAAVQTGGLGIDDRTATAIYGIYTAAVYLLALPGGWIADRLLGQQKAVWYGGIIIALGHFTMASPLLRDWYAGLAGPMSAELHLGIEYTAFYMGLLLIVIGTGLLKPNISAIVGELYQGDAGARRDAGFTIFYMGINLGAFAGPLVCGFLGEKIDWHYGFGAAGVGMVLGLVQYRMSGAYLGDAGLRPHADPDPVRDASEKRRGGLYVGVGTGALLLTALLMLTGVLDVDPVTLAQGTGVFIVALAALYFAYLFLFAGLDTGEKKRVAVIVALFFGAAMFWSGFEQAGSSLNLFAERYTDRTLFGWVHPASWYQSLNPLFILILAPFFAWFWVSLARRNLEPSTPLKFALGLAQLGAGFLVMFFAATLLVAGGGEDSVLPTWLLMTYLLHTLGELCLSPVGLSAVTKLAPRRYVGQMMGVWFMGAALGNLIGGLVAGYFGDESLEQMPERYMTIVMTTVGAGVLFAVFSRPLRRWMGGVR